jgi:hypothetical protein
MLLFFTTVVFVIIIALTSKKKPNKTVGYPSAPLLKNKASSIPINPKALELSTKHFGWEWMQFLAQRGQKLKLTNEEIRRGMALGYSQMGVKPLEHLLLSFIQMKVNTNGAGRSLAFDDYGDLHISTLELIKLGRFSPDNIQEMLTILAERARTELVRRKEEEKRLNAKVATTFAIIQPIDTVQVTVPIIPKAVAPIENKIFTEIKAIAVQADPDIIEVGSASQLIPFEEITRSSPVLDQMPQPAYSGYDPDEYSLGKKYKKKLNLSPQEASWLNKFYNYSNVFNAIEGCELEIIKLYLLALKLIVKRLKKEGTSLSQEIMPLKAKMADFERSQSYYWEGNNNTQLGNSAETDAYYFIYKKAEMVIRESWGHRRKITADFYSRSEEVKSLFNARLGPIIEDVIEHLKPTIGIPDETTELALNEAGTTRWREKFQQITAGSISINDVDRVVASLYELGRMNVRNSSVEHIYYEASKFMVALDKLESLRLYLHYVWYDLHSVVVDNKQLNKTIQKKLFSNEHQLKIFTGIIDELSRTRDLKAALAALENIFKAPRKVIVLDTLLIKKVEEQHSGTVAVLSEYLQDEEEVYELKAPVQQPTILEEALASTGLSTVQPTIDLSSIQLAFLSLFASNFNIDTVSAEDFAKEHGVFKNQLIDGINELCYELLDDVLIEESAEGYEINPDYFKQIIS